MQVGEPTPTVNIVYRALKYSSSIVQPLLNFLNGLVLFFNLSLMGVEIEKNS